MDVSPWLRSDAPTSADRLFCHVYGRGKGNAQMIPGWPYSFVAALETGPTSWTAPLDAVRQRCRVHFMRNVLGVVPRANAEMVAALIRTILGPVKLSALAQKRWLLAEQDPQLKSGQSLAPQRLPLTERPWD